MLVYRLLIEKLKKLKIQLGDEVYKKVTTALIKLNKYNDSGRYPVSDLWNFKEERNASLEEGVLQTLRNNYIRVNLRDNSLESSSNVVKKRFWFFRLILWKRNVSPLCMYYSAGVFGLSSGITL
ncbi:hypothetical protein M0R45_031305 [Rubus argutus]|uniref:Factor of DNA methylation 1-5/IDN2 domain-containing protein n=1 Tax=Rubus argutus TaxID=59490 RepID=A0AAW1WD70_RUBAR